MESESLKAQKIDTHKQPEFMKIGLDAMYEFRNEVADLEDTLLDIQLVGGADISKNVFVLNKALRNFEPSVTMIGQIKSGKTTLVNAMVGRPDLLPADVNPWTSVVTSLHLNPETTPDSPVASFQFFDKNEWDHPVKDGGRIGELSKRAGADDELRKLQEQISAMREKTRERLGRKFELMLGQQHNYSHFDEDLIHRYVCMGDDFDELSVAEQQGRFADITKSADLFLSASALPMSMCIRDTPGVNDTFMMREQITIKSLRDSRICVVVLSAHQALSSVDMGLIRLIANVKSREIIVFVNRIDELSDPEKQIPDIRRSILKTLADNNGPKDPEVVFGSAYWANVALAQTYEDIFEDSAEALRKCAKAFVGDEAAVSVDDYELLWQLSGVPHLYDALAQRIVKGPGAELLSSVRKRALNQVSGLRASSSIVSMRLEGSTIEVMNKNDLAVKLDTLEADAMRKLQDQLDTVFQKFSARVDQSHKRFLDRALESLLQHLETKGEDQMWQYSPDGLRILLRTSYQVMRKNFVEVCEGVFEEAATDLADIYRKVFSVNVDNFSISTPSSPEVPPPVSLGLTIALDLQTSWWKGWWKRRKGYRAYANSFYDLIEAETAPIVDELKNRQATEIRQMAMEQLADFLAEQRGILVDVSDKAKISLNDLNALFGITAQRERDELIETICEELSLGDMMDGDENQATEIRGMAV